MLECQESHTKFNNQHYANQRVHANFMNVSPIIKHSRKAIIRTPQTPGSSVLEGKSFIASLIVDLIFDRERESKPII